MKKKNNVNNLSIQYTLKEFSTELLSMELQSEFNGTGRLSVIHSDKEIPHAATVKSKVISTDGLCVIETDLLAKKNMTGVFDINGPHVRFTFLFDDSESTDVTKMTGNLEISFEQGGEYQVSFQKNRHNYVVSVILSREYYLELAKSEYLTHNFHLYSNVSKNIPYRSEVNFFQINMPIKHILDKVLNNSFIGLMKRQYVDTKIKGLFSLLCEQEMKEATVTEMVDDEILEKLYKARDILNTSYQAPPTIKQLSRMILLNELKLKQGFKQLFNTTIHNYLIKLRMEAAYTLMNEKNVLIFEVAMQMGYKDTSHFINVFKKYFGYTPKYFCKNIRNPIKAFLPFVMVAQQVFDIAEMGTWT